jgi:hypothetical protein
VLSSFWQAIIDDTYAAWATSFKNPIPYPPFEIDSLHCVQNASEQWLSANVGRVGVLITDLTNARWHSSNLVMNVCDI